MSALKSFPLNHQISEEAAEWLVEFRTGDIDAAGRKAFDAWLRTSPEHLRAFIEMAAIWNQGSGVDAERRVDLEALVKRIQAEGNVSSLAKPEAQERPVTRKAFYRSPPKPLAVAASLIVLAGAALVSWHFLAGERAYVTEAGERRSLTLADGSTVTLDSRSALRVAFTKAKRIVELQRGQALFHVAKDPSRPFVVRAAETSVRAVGTIFDVDEKQEGTLVTVVEGRVAVGQSGDGEPGRGHAGRAAEADAYWDVHQDAPDTILLAAGEQVSVAPGASTPAVRKSANVASATAWTQGQLIFDAASLAEVAEAFNRYSPRKLMVEDHGATPLRLSGVFVTRPDFLIDYLGARADITIRETPTEVRIVRTDREGAPAAK